MTTIIAIVNAIAIKRATINVRSSSTSYAWLNAFVRAFTPFEADHNVPRILIDNNPPFCALTNWLIFVFINSVISDGAYLSIKTMKDCSSIGKYPSNVIKKTKKGNKDNKTKYASCAANPNTSASSILLYKRSEERRVGKESRSRRWT